MKSERGKNLAKWFLFILALVIVIFAIFHFIQSIRLILSTDLELWHQIIIGFQLIIEGIIFLQTILIIIGIINMLDHSNDLTDTPKLEIYPDLDVFVPVRQVDPKILENTIEGIVDNNYPEEKLHLFIADDTPEKELSDKYREIADKHGATFIYDPTNIKYKAGMLNIAIKEGKSEFISFFDFDQRPLPGVLRHFVEVLADNPKASFIQAKKIFHNLYNMARIWSAVLYLQFFEVFERSKNKLKTVMFAGSTACFRREDLDLVGGLPEDTFTEDNELTLRLLLIGKYGIFSDREGSLGTVPNGFRQQIAQLWRWSHGGSHTLKIYMKRLITSKKLDRAQKTDIISTLAITPLFVFVYLYTASFLPLLLTNVDSPRMILFGMSSIAMAPISISLTYVFFASFAIWFGKESKYSEYEFKHMPGFLLLAISSNFLIISSGVLGTLGIWGPKSKRGKWTREINVFGLGIISFILGSVMIYFSIVWLSQGLTAAIIIMLIGFTLIPTLPVVLYYGIKDKYDD